MLQILSKLLLCIMNERDADLLLGCADNSALSG